MPGRVPLLSGLEFRRVVSAPSCHPGLVPGSRPAPDADPGEAGRERCRCPGPRHKAGVTAGETPARRNRCLGSRGPVETRWYPSDPSSPQNPNRTAVGAFLASTSLRRETASALPRPLPQAGGEKMRGKSTDVPGGAGAYPFRTRPFLRRHRAAARSPSSYPCKPPSEHRLDRPPNSVILSPARAVGG